LTLDSQFDVTSQIELMQMDLFAALNPNSPRNGGLGLGYTTL
jgi:hypothetical protein